MTHEPWKGFIYLMVEVPVLLTVFLCKCTRTRGRMSRKKRASVEERVGEDRKENRHYEELAAKQSRYVAERHTGMMNAVVKAGLGWIYFKVFFQMLFFVKRVKYQIIYD